MASNSAGRGLHPWARRSDERRHRAARRRQHPEATKQLLAANAIPWRIDLRGGDPDPDCLVQNEPGRYLWLRVTLGGNGAISARVSSARLFFPIGPLGSDGHQ